MSRPLKSDEEKKLIGTFQAVRARPNQPKVAKGMPRMPKHLTGIAEETWIEFADILAEMNVLAKIDGKALEAGAQAYADRRKALAYRDALDSWWNEIKDKDGNVTGHKLRPEVGLFASLDAAFMKWLQVLGMTPVQRNQLVARPKEEDEDNPYV